MAKHPPRARDDPARDEGDDDRHDERDDASYPIAIALRRSRYTGQFERRRPNDPEAGLFGPLR